MIGEYMTELERSLRVRNRRGGRFLAECRDHLAELAEVHGEAEAIAVFGSAAAVADAFNGEVAASRSIGATWWSVAGVLATGGSTLALIHAAQPGASGPIALAVVFFVSAQVAAVASGLAVLQALTARRSDANVSESALLCRRNAVALFSGGLAMFTAGAAVAGSGSAVALLAGPALACAAAVVLLRAWRSTRGPSAEVRWADRSPFDDVRRLTGLPVPSIGPIPVAAIAGLCAFIRDRGEAGSSLGEALSVAAIEAVAVVVCFVALRRPLGLASVRASLTLPE